MKERPANGYDLIRIIAAFMVVVIHSNVIFLSNCENSIGLFAGIEITTLCVVSVPLFFMVSGATLLRKEQKVDEKSFGHRIVKQFVPFVIWSLIYLFARMIMGKIPFHIKSVWTLISEPAYYQFWFMYTLLAIYMLLPFLECIVRHCSKKHIEYALVLWFVFSVCQPVLEYLTPLFKISSHVDLIICEGYIGFFILGYYLKEYHSTVSMGKSLLVFTCGMIILQVQSGLEFFVAGEEYNGYFQGTYLTPGVVIAVVGFFLFLQNCKYEFHPIIKKIASLTMGIFYIHLLVLAAFETIGFKGENNLLICECKALIVFVVSLIIVALMKKFKLGRVLVR